MYCDEDHIKGGTQWVLYFKWHSQKENENVVNHSESHIKNVTQWVLYYEWHWQKESENASKCNAEKESGPTKGSLHA